jgi:hypothetical protein
MDAYRFFSYEDPLLHRGILMPVSVITLIFLFSHGWSSSGEGYDN